MTDTDTLARIEAVLTAATDPNVGVPQRFSAQLKADGLAVNTYPEALAVVRAATEVMNRYSEQGHCDDSASWAGFDRLDRALAAFLSAARDATEAGS